MSMMIQPGRFGGPESIPTEFETLIGNGSFTSGTHTADVDIGDEDASRILICVWSHGRSVAAGVASNNIPTIDGTPFTIYRAGDYNDMWFSFGFMPFPTGSGTKTFSMVAGGSAMRYSVYKLTGALIVDYAWFFSGAAADMDLGYYLDGLEDDMVMSIGLGDQTVNPLFAGQDEQLNSTQDFTWSPNLNRIQTFGKTLTADTGRTNVAMVSSSTSVARAMGMLRFRAIEGNYPPLDVQVGCFNESVTSNATRKVQLGEEDPDRYVILCGVHRRVAATGTVNAITGATLDGNAMTATSTISPSSRYRMTMHYIHVPTGTGEVDLVTTGGSNGSSDYKILVVRGVNISTYQANSGNVSTKIEATISSVNAGDLVIAHGARTGNDLDDGVYDLFDTAGRVRGGFTSGTVNDSTPGRSQVSVLEVTSTGSFTAGIANVPATALQGIQLLRLTPA